MFAGSSFSYFSQTKPNCSLIFPWSFSSACSASGHCREEPAGDVVCADVVINMVFIFGAAWCLWCTGGMLHFSLGSLLGISVEWCLLGSQPHGVMASLPCQLVATLGSRCWGSARVHRGFTLRLCQRGDFTASLSFYSFSISKDAGLVSQQEVRHCREDENP